LSVPIASRHARAFANKEFEADETQNEVNQAQEKERRSEELAAAVAARAFMGHERIEESGPTVAAR